MKKKICLCLLALWLLATVIPRVQERIQTFQTKQQARDYVKNLPVEYTHEVKGDCSLSDVFFEELLSLGAWSQANLALLEPPSRSEKFDHWEYLYRQTIEEETAPILRKLEEERRLRLEEIFEGRAVCFGIKRDTVQACLKAGRFDKILKVVELLEKGEGRNAFEEGRRIGKEWKNLLYDIGFALYPQVLIQGCEESLHQGLASPDKSSIVWIVTECQEFSERYHVTLTELEEGISQRSAYEFEQKLDIPYVGMPLSELDETKLGHPSRMEHKTQTLGGKTSTYGYIYWIRNGRTIFKAYYYKDQIKLVWDRRENGKGTGTSSKRAAGSSSYRGQSTYARDPIDPEEHDIEAYYEDNLDEYEDYEDAYDGFLDEESEWDNY